MSKERVDRTMTAGVGILLGMAPEVILGERYDEQVKNQEKSNGVILQQVTIGKMQVNYSQLCPRSIVELGRACVASNPRDRPTAAEACNLSKRRKRRNLYN